MDGYIAFGDIHANSINTANKTIRNMIAFFPKGNTCLPRADSAVTTRVR